MRKITLTYGVICGLIVISSIILGLVASGGDGMLASEAFGYLIMLVALSMICLGIKRYRDLELGGVIKFMPAFLTGLAIAAIAGVMYVAMWEIYLVSTDYAFINDYVVSVLEAKKAAGITGPEYDAIANEMEKVKADYGKIYKRLPMTFLEIFPLGALIALLSALVLRNPRVLNKQSS
jgi:hypothetical protein